MQIEIILMKHAKRLVLMLAMLVITAGPAVAKDYDLHQAVLDKNIGMVKRLLNKGLYIDEIGSRKYGYGSALHLAVREGHLNIAKLLLDRGAQVDVLDPDDFTPLHNAAWNGNLDMAKLLLEAGADIEASTYDGDTPLSLAQNNDQAQVAEFIQAKLQPSADISGTYISEIIFIRGHGLQKAYFFMRKKNRKEITLEQTGNAISGVDGPKNPKINGTREGNTINFYILTPFHHWGNDIYGTWEINADATEMVGKWHTEDGMGGTWGKWNLKRIQ